MCSVNVQISLQDSFDDNIQEVMHCFCVQNLHANFKSRVSKVRHLRMSYGVRQ